VLSAVQDVLLIFAFLPTRSHVAEIQVKNVAAHIAAYRASTARPLPSLTVSTGFHVVVDTTTQYPYNARL
jgi:hypothetical protein